MSYFKATVHLRQPGFTYSTCRHYTEHRERTEKFKETDDLKYIYKNELDKACFPHDAAYASSNDLAKTTFSGKVLKDEAYETALNPQYDGYQRGLYGLKV